MKLQSPEKKEHPEAEAQITSLIDVALSLVIFFIITLPALLESGIFVKAPGIQQVGGQEQGDEFKVSIYLKEDGTILLNDEPVDKQRLGDLMELLLQRSVEKRVVVRADGGVDYGKLVEVLDMAKQRKAEKLALFRGKPLEGGGL